MFWNGVFSSIKGWGVWLVLVILFYWSDLLIPPVCLNSFFDPEECSLLIFWFHICCLIPLSSRLHLAQAGFEWFICDYLWPWEWAWVCQDRQSTVDWKILKVIGRNTREGRDITVVCGERNVGSSWMLWRNRRWLQRREWEGEWTVIKSCSPSRLHSSSDRTATLRSGNPRWLSSPKETIERYWKGEDAHVVVELIKPKVVVINRLCNSERRA